MLLNGVTVVLSGSKEKVPGMSISWATLVEKNHLIISVPKNSLPTQSLLENREFSVNVLGQGQEDIAKQFVRKTSKKPKKSDDAIKYTKKVFPIISSCCSTLNSYNKCLASVCSD